MPHPQCTRRSCNTVALLFAFSVGCRGEIVDEPQPFQGAAATAAGRSAAGGSGSVAAGSGAGAAVAGKAAAGSGAASAAATGSLAGAAGMNAPPTGPSQAALTVPMLPARIRRLTNAEFDATVSSLLGVQSTYGASFTPDTRQDGFTRNDAQRVDPVFMTQLDAAAKQLSLKATEQVNNLAYCSDASQAATAEMCARSFFMQFAARAYRRPVTAREIDALMTVYKAGAEGATYKDGIQLAVQALLESPGFLYVTEIGSQPMAADARLTEHEIAVSLAYLLTGAPPDGELLKAANDKQLSAPDTRKPQIDRLLRSDAAGRQITRMVEEWLGIDRIVETAKDAAIYPAFAGLRDAMKREADLFVSEVMWKQGAPVSELLTADWTLADDSLARVYLGSDQLPQRNNNRISLSTVRRRGILEQSAFLSVYAHAHETAPVLRGVAVLRRVLCANVPAPSSLNVNIIPPVADPTKTTRERFTVHSQDAACSACHQKIDAIGFTFEGLDAMGRARTTENNRPVDTATQLHAGFSFDGTFADSTALVEKLAGSSELQSCFARHLFRNASARNTESEAVEAAFLERVAALPAGAQGKFADVLAAFTGSDLFTLRRTAL